MGQKSLPGCRVADSPVVVTLHLEIEDLALGVAGLGDEEFVEEGEDVAADLLELLLDLFSVLLGHLLFALGTLSLLFDRGDDPPGGSPGAHDILVGHGQEIPREEEHIFLNLRKRLYFFVPF